LTTIRTASQSDIPALAELCSQLGYQCVESEVEVRLADLINRSDHILLVAVSESGKVVGWAHGAVRRLLITPAHVELGGLVVEKSQRGQGTGEMLMSAIEAWAFGQGIETVFLRSNAIRTDAHRFYKKLGYEQVKTSLTFTKTLRK
jgi:N-acetylglutamate synthase-like GNAT family acetyltransferase